MQRDLYIFCKHLSFVFSVNCLFHVSVPGCKEMMGVLIYDFTSLEVIKRKDKIYLG